MIQVPGVNGEDESSDDDESDEEDDDSDEDDTSDDETPKKVYAAIISLSLLSMACKFSL